MPKFRARLASGLLWLSESRVGLAILFFGLPTLSNLVAISLGSSITVSKADVSVLVFTVLFTPVATIAGYFMGAMGPRLTSLALFAQAGLLICAFAVAYRATGLTEAGTPIEQLSFTTALYFSVITWTSVGYGDLVPSVASRSFASTEALMGYVYLTVVASIGLRDAGGPETDVAPTSDPVQEGKVNS